MLSFSIDWSAIWSTASAIAGGLLPVYLVPLGIIIGMAILSWIMRAIKGAIGGGG
jgi:hypothetical protein